MLVNVEVFAWMITQFSYSIRIVMRGKKKKKVKILQCSQFLRTLLSGQNEKFLYPTLTGVFAMVCWISTGSGSSPCCWEKAQ